MPELPEVEVAKCGITPFVLGNKITKVNLYSEKLRWPVPDVIKDELIGYEILSIIKRGQIYF